MANLLADLTSRWKATGFIKCKALLLLLKSAITVGSRTIKGTLPTIIGSSVLLKPGLLLRII
jgi:hypothetical protein